MTSGRGTQPEGRTGKREETESDEGRRRADSYDRGGRRPRPKDFMLPMSSPSRHLPIFPPIQAISDEPVGCLSASGGAESGVTMVALGASSSTW